MVTKVLRYKEKYAGGAQPASGTGGEGGGVTMSVTLSSSVATGLKQQGTTISNMVLTVKYVAIPGSTPTALKLYRNGTEIHSFPLVAGTTTYTYTESSLSANATYVAKASNSTETVSSRSLVYTFVTESYYGSVLTPPTTESDILALDQVLAGKSTQSLEYTVEDGYCIYAYDKSYGALSSIVDTMGFEYLNTFTQSEITVDDTDYYVYTSEQATLDNFKYTFKF